MTDPTPTPTPPADPQASANPSTQGDPADLGDAGRRAIAAERAAAADATRQLRETQMQLVGMQGRVTELENTLGTLTTERDTATGDALRYRVALENGVPPALAGRLQGADEASLIADAATLLGAIPTPEA
jgi:TolA-binding protein